MGETPNTIQIEVTIDLAPKKNGKKFDEWCAKHGFTPLGSDRRAWCSSMSTYFRDAIGIGQTTSGETFLVFPEDLPIND